jgi:hypothetical protein
MIPVDVHGGYSDLIVTLEGIQYSTQEPVKMPAGVVLIGNMQTPPASVSQKSLERESHIGPSSTHSRHL